MNNQKVTHKQKSKKAPKQKSVKAVAAESAPVARSSKNRTGKPVISYEKDGMSCLVSHRERIGTVLGSVAFTNNTYSVNPGLVATFPWLANIANRFESYRFEELVFEFRTKTATTALGDVIMALDYDASDSAPTSSVQLESYQGAVSAAPWQDQNCFSTKANLHKLPQRYCRAGAVPANADVKLYDVGTLFVSTENQASAALIGYLYVKYKVRFFTPQLASSDFGITGGVASGSTANTAANPMGTTVSVDAQSRGFSVNTASRLTFDSIGSYLVDCQLNGTVLSSILFTPGSNATVTSTYSPIANSGATKVAYQALVVVSAPAAYIDITATGTTVTAAVLTVGSVPEGSIGALLLRGCRAKDRRACFSVGMGELASKFTCPTGCPCGNI